MTERVDSFPVNDADVDVEEPLLGDADDFLEKEGHGQHRLNPHRQAQAWRCAAALLEAPAAEPLCVCLSRCFECN